MTEKNPKPETDIIDIGYPISIWTSICGVVLFARRTGAVAFCVLSAPERRSTTVCRGFQASSFTQTIVPKIALLSRGHFAFISSLIISVTNCDPRKHIVPRLSYTRLDGGICTPLNSDVKVYRYVASRDCCLTLPHKWPENCPVIIFSTIKRTSLRTDNN